ncbi:MAG: FKBP-type peptidyl-prolyl cis-trans isomerase [Mariprofundaceae bacterium]|nr:FKBP-type peptidyl-prolyl cis-trans isomerase [Mariprofundaceae bacterium]
MYGISINLVWTCVLLAFIATSCSQSDNTGSDDRQQLPENARAGKAFLKENARKEGVVTRPSGLQYRILRAGNGNRPRYTDEVTVHYRGTHLDGSEFDNSYSRGKPAVFRLNRVIPGWTEALQLMREGAKWQLFIPPELAYGSRGAGSAIGPNETLVFDVELLKINQMPAQ